MSDSDRVTAEILGPHITGKKMFIYDIDNYLTMFGPKAAQTAHLYTAIFRNEFILIFVLILKQSGKRPERPRNAADDNRIYLALYQMYCEEVEKLLKYLGESSDLYDSDPKKNDICYRWQNYLGRPNKFAYHEYLDNIIHMFKY